MRAYLDLVRHVLTTGHRRENRTGVDTLATFGASYSVDLADGFPLLTTKAVSWKNIVAETLWFLSGETSIAFLHRHGCRFWDSWARGGHVTAGYGPAWRRFPTAAGPNDQIAYVLAELARNPLSRRLVVSAWEPGDTQTNPLPPCHVLQVYNVQHDPEPRLNLHLTQRSADIALGVPYNLAGYALMLDLMARFSGLKPGRFFHSIADAHIYTSKADGSQAEHDHIPGLVQQLAREPRRLPRLTIAPWVRSLADLTPLMECGTEEMLSAFVLEGYEPHPAIGFKVAV